MGEKWVNQLSPFACWLWNLLSDLFTGLLFMNLNRATFCLFVYFSYLFGGIIRNNHTYNIAVNFNGNLKKRQLPYLNMAWKTATLWAINTQRRMDGVQGFVCLLDVGWAPQLTCLHWPHVPDSPVWPALIAAPAGEGPLLQPSHPLAQLPRPVGPCHLCRLQDHQDVEQGHGKKAKFRWLDGLLLHSFILSFMAEFRDLLCRRRLSTPALVYRNEWGKFATVAGRVSALPTANHMPNWGNIAPIILQRCALVLLCTVFLIPYLHLQYSRANKKHYENTFNKVV